VTNNSLLIMTFDEDDRSHLAWHRRRLLPVRRVPLPRRDPDSRRDQDVPRM